MAREEAAAVAEAVSVVEVVVDEAEVASAEGEGVEVVSVTGEAEMVDVDEVLQEGESPFHDVVLLIADCSQWCQDWRYRSEPRQQSLVRLNSTSIPHSESSVHPPKIRKFAEQLST